MLVLENSAVLEKPVDPLPADAALSQAGLLSESPAARESTPDTFAAGAVPLQSGLLPRNLGVLE
eukprot:13374659-Alexandrium_andersonii.AAC.1